MHNKHIKSNHRKIPLLLLSIGGAFLFSYLTFIPMPVHAAYDWETRTLSSINTMQEMNAKICENTTEIETQYTLRDTRDDKIYYVAKLKDGNCWMTQNLAYSGTEYDNIGTPCTLSGTSCSGWSNSSTEKYFAIGQYTNSNHTSQGNYYNWPTAVQNGSGGTDIQGVCPIGWQLPTGNNTITNKSFGKLAAAYSVGDSSTGSTIMRGSPLYFRYSGYVFGGTLSDSSSYGYYWSSTVHDSSFAYRLYLGSDIANPSYYDGRANGFSIRCVNADIYPEPPIDDSTQANVSITVSPVISIDVTQHVDTEVDFTHVAKSNIIARVGSNQPYQVLFSTDQSNLEQSPILTNQNIPMITSDQTITAGTSNWGIKKLSSPTDTTTTPDTIYSPVGIGDNKALFYTSNTAASEDLTFPVAIAVSPQLPSGKYSTQATLTAVAM